MTRQRVHLNEVARFAITGVLAWFVDVLAFNMLSDPTGHIAAKVISSIIAITVAYLGSRYYTWPSHPPATAHPIIIFVAVSAVAATVQLGFLWVSHDLIGWTSAMADNLSANVVGMAAATAVRFWGFRYLIFRAPSPEPESAGIRRSGAAA